jgi:hypothetical protein
LQAARGILQLRCLRKGSLGDEDRQGCPFYWDDCPLNDLAESGAATLRPYNGVLGFVEE